MNKLFLKIGTVDIFFISLKNDKETMWKELDLDPNTMCHFKFLNCLLKELVVKIYYSNYFFLV